MTAPSATPHLSSPVLDLAGVSKSFGGVDAVRDVTLRVAAGTVHGLVGENGAGKTTLIRMMAGALAPDVGTIHVAGRGVESVEQARAAGLAMLPQELTLVPGFDAIDNIVLGTDLPSRLGVVDRARARRIAVRALERLEVDLPIDVPVGGLSPARQQLVSIARALAHTARVLVLDEPTAALTDREVEHLVALMRRLRADGLTIIHVSHRLDEIFAVCDDVTVMRDGSIVTTAPVDELTPERLITHMIGAPADQAHPPKGDEVGEVVLAARALTGRRVRDLDLQVRAGEVVGIGGLGGSGRSELLRLLHGAQRRVAGEIDVAGERLPTRHRTPHAHRAGIALVPEERRSQGLVMRRSVRDNLALATLRAVCAAPGVVSRRRLRRHAAGSIDDLRIKVDSPRQLVWQLSGGNQQKVVLGRVLASRPRVLLLDEPTRGIDVGTKNEIHRLIRELATKGHAIVLVSSDLPELLGMADRVVVLHEGRRVADEPSGALDQQGLLALCYGRERP